MGLAVDRKEPALPHCAADPKGIGSFRHASHFHAESCRWHSAGRIGKRRGRIAMSNPAQEHLSIAEEKLRRFLALAEEILALKAALKQRLDEALQAGAFTETLRTSTII